MKLSQHQLTALKLLNVEGAYARKRAFSETYSVWGGPQFASRGELPKVTINALLKRNLVERSKDGLIRITAAGRAEAKL